jgi:DNA-binding NtrC family response regulator
VKRSAESPSLSRHCARPFARIEAWLVRRALEGNQHQRADTARRLGITRKDLYS